jgi:hypothetical protein
VDASRAGTCWLISLDLLRQPEVAALLARTMWTMVVIDEAHLAAPGTARLEAVVRVAASSVRVLLLTATPHAAGPPGVDVLRAIGGRPGERPMLVLRREAALGERPARRTRVLHVSLGEGHGALCARLDRFVQRARRDAGAQGLLPALVLRRRASSCPAALVRSLERRLQVLGTAPDDGPQPSLFDEDANTDEDGRDDEVMRMRAWTDEVAEREELRRLLALAGRLPPEGAKLRAVARLLRRCREPAVVFTGFVDTLRALRSCLRGHRTVMVHGRQPDALRMQAIEAFTSGEADVLLTTDASAEGLNLHARCRLVVHAEVPVSARSLLQRTGRVDRHGQTRRVHAVVLGSDSFEDRESLSRLRARASDEPSWTGRTSTPRCVRTMVAARRLEGKAASNEGGGGGEGGRERPRQGAPHALVCVLRRRAWTRLIERVGSAPDTRIVWVGALRCGGSPMLSTCRVPAAIAGCARVARAPDAALRGARIWQTLLPHALVRVRRLAARLATWEEGAEARCRRADAARAPAPGLFDDAREEEGERRSAPVAAVEPGLAVAFDIVAVLERRR